MKYRRNHVTYGLSVASILITATAFLFAVCPAWAADKKPNIVFIMGDDIGWSNIGAYNRGIMSGKTPNLDQLAAQGMLFTDYYAEASCTAGRAKLYHWRIADPHRAHHCRSGRLPARNARRSADDCHGA